MKKLALLLALVLLVSVISFPASADTIDYSFIEENADVYELEVEDNGNAFISMSLGKNEFEHKNLVEGYVSLIYSDIIVVDYNSSDPFPFWRLWIEYTADTFLGIRMWSIILISRKMSRKSNWKKSPLRNSRSSWAAPTMISGWTF